MAERDFLPPFAAVNVTLPLPLPLAGLTVNQAALSDAVQATVEGLTVTVTTSVPPPAGALHVVGLSVTVPPACVTLTVFPPSVTVPVRLVKLVVDAAVRVMLPLPVPLVGLTVNQAALSDAVQARVEGLAVTVTPCVPPAAGAFQVVGLSVTVPPACVTLTVCPPSVTVPVRLVRLVVDAVVNVTLPLPVPLVGLTVNQPALLDAVQPRVAELAVTVTPCVPPAAGAFHVVGLSVKVAPDCVTLTVVPPSVTVPVRLVRLVVDAAVSVTLPLPVPLVGMTVNQTASLDAVHVRVEGLAVTVTAWVPPAAGAFQVVGLRES